jgi:dimethylhistidine N-methyltransferase
MALDNSVPVHNDSNPHAGLREELLAGLERRPRAINPKFFYDERGSELFARICLLQEYYPTRTEIGIFRSRSAEIARAVGPGCELVEPGAGSCEKVRHLLEDMQPAAYIPIDISGDFLVAAADSLRKDFPRLDVRPVVADFSDHFDLPPTRSAGRRVLFYPGSTIGNFEPEAARAFLCRVADLVGPGGALLIGADLHKSSEVLNAAYNDSQGVTAAFNRNILRHANRLLDAEFEPDRFKHVAFYNEQVQRIEMHLESFGPQRVRCNGAVFEFAAGERIHTEYSYKYRLDEFAALAATAGFRPRECWVDANEWFSVQYFIVD